MSDRMDRLHRAIIVSLAAIALSQMVSPELMSHAQPMPPGAFPIQSVLGVVPPVDIPNPIDELSDTTITLKNFRNANGVTIKPTSIQGTVTDLATGQQLFAFGPTAPTGKTWSITMPAANDPIVSPGLCSLSRATVCSASSACPAGESCLPVAIEIHVLELVFGPGQGTKQVLFPVRNHFFLPLS